MTATIEHLTANELDDAVLPVSLMPEASAQLALLEAQLRGLPSDRKAIAEEERDRYIEQLMGDRPGQTLINEIVFLSGIYDGRAVEQTLEDGSGLRSWGTRDKSNQYLSHRYYVHQRTDGRIDYRVMTLDEHGRKFFEIDDAGNVDVTVLGAARFTHDFSPYRPYRMTEAGADQAMRDLFRASMVSADEVRERQKHGGNEAADRSALQLLGSGPVESELYAATSDADVQAVFNRFTAEKPVPAHLLKLPKFATIV